MKHSPQVLKELNQLTSKKTVAKVNAVLFFPLTVTAKMGERIGLATPSDWLKALKDRLPEHVRSAICCLGYTQIDTPGERDHWADVITERIGEQVPFPYKLAWPVIRPSVKRIVRAMLDQAATMGDKYCEGLVCPLSPIAIGG